MTLTSPNPHPFFLSLRLSYDTTVSTIQHCLWEHYQSYNGIYLDVRAYMTHVSDFSVPRIVEAHASVRLLIAYRAA
jgi:hypothetical protein